MNFCLYLSIVNTHITVLFIYISVGGDEVEQQRQQAQANLATLPPTAALAVEAYNRLQEQVRAEEVNAPAEGAAAQDVQQEVVVQVQLDIPEAEAAEADNLNENGSVESGSSVDYGKLFSIYACFHTHTHTHTHTYSEA